MEQVMNNSWPTVTETHFYIEGPKSWFLVQISGRTWLRWVRWEQDPDYPDGYWWEDQ